MNNNCKYVGGGYCFCSTCQSMRKMIEELKKVNVDEIMSKEEVKKVFEEAEKLLKVKGCGKDGCD